MTGAPWCSLRDDKLRVPSPKASPSLPRVRYTFVLAVENYFSHDYVSERFYQALPARARAALAPARRDAPR